MFFAVPKPEPFEAYYQRRYQEELRKMCSKPTLSIGFCMVMANLPKYVRAKAKAEYDNLAHKRRSAELFNAVGAF